MWKKVGSVLLAIAFLSGLGVLIYRQFHAALEEKVLAAKKGQTAPPLIVQVEEVNRGPITESLQLTGTVQGRTQVTVFSMVPGAIKHIYVKEGDCVRKGQVLARLDARKMALGVRQAKAAAAMATANLALMELTYSRMKALYQDQVIPKAQLDQVETGYKAAKLQVQQAQAAVGLAKAQLSDAIIRAPISGQVLEKFVSQGDVSSAAAMMKTSPLLLLGDVSSVKVKAAVVEKELGRVRVGQEATLTVDAYPDRIFRGRVVEVGAMVDPMTRTAQVTVEIPNSPASQETAARAGSSEEHVRNRQGRRHGGHSDRAAACGGLLKVGMFARVSIVLGHKERAIVVPRDAVLGPTGAHYVFVVKQSKAVRRDVSLGIQSREQVEVTRGLQAGDQLVVLGHRWLTDGQAVRVVRNALPLNQTHSPAESGSETRGTGSPSNTARPNKPHAAARSPRPGRARP